MTIGTSIFVIALGAIMMFAVRTDLGWLDVQTAGGVLMVTGVVMLAITVTMWRRRRRQPTVGEDAAHRPSSAPDSHTTVGPVDDH